MPLVSSKGLQSLRGADVDGKSLQNSKTSLDRDPAHKFYDYGAITMQNKGQVHFMDQRAKTGQFQVSGGGHGHKKSSMQDLTSYIRQVQLPADGAQSQKNHYFEGPSTRAFVGGASIVNLETADGRPFRGVGGHKSATKIGAARAAQQRRKKTTPIGLQQVIPHHKKNISYESYLMNRPVVRRYSNAYEAISGDEGFPESAVVAASVGDPAVTGAAPSE